MVNFNVKLRNNIYAEWRDQYIDYKRLKKMLKKRKNGEEKLLENSPLLVLSTPSVVSSELAFETELEKELEKVAKNYKNRISEFSQQFQLLQQQYRKNASEPVKQSLQNSLVELYRLLNLLQNYAILNYTGFIKILKKHDKFIPNHKIRPYYSKLLLTYDFSEGKECQNVISNLEKMFALEFCDGNMSVARASLLVRREESVDWNHIIIGVRMGSCVVLLLWVVWDTVISPAVMKRKQHKVIGLLATRGYPVYRGIGCFILLHWLWGVSLYVWRSARINYRYIFELDPRYTKDYAQTFSDATTFSIFYLINILLYNKVVNGSFPSEILPPGYYPLILFAAAIIYYFILSWKYAKPLVIVVLQTVLSPLFPVSFYHTFVGDYLTSTVKVNQDMCWSLCFFFTGEFLQPDITFHDLKNGKSSITSSCSQNFYYAKVAVPLVCALPLWFRFQQNLRRISDTGKWCPNIANAFKYALAQIVVLFGVFHPLYDPDSSDNSLTLYQIFYIILFALSSLYTWCWDVFMDWGLGRPKYSFLGDRRMYSATWVYYGAIVMDFFLRFSWTLSLIPPESSSIKVNTEQTSAKLLHFISINSFLSYVLPFTMVAELFRRTMWSFFRLENEHLRNTQGFRRVDFIPLHYDHGVGVGTSKPNNNNASNRSSLWTIALITFLVIGLSIAAIVVSDSASNSTDSSSSSSSST